MEIWHRRAAPANSDTVGAQLLPVVRKSLRVFVVIVAAIVTLQNVGMDVTGLLASLSIGGLALGLAAQDTLANLFGAVALFADRPFRVGTGSSSTPSTGRWRRSACAAPASGTSTASS